MSKLIKEIEDTQIRKDELKFSVGDTVKVHNRIKEGDKERIQIFEGVVLKYQGGQNKATFTVRKNSNGVGVEKTFPVSSPLVAKVEVVRKGKVRRNKLLFLRDRMGKASKVKEDI